MKDLKAYSVTQAFREGMYGQFRELTIGLYYSFENERKKTRADHYHIGCGFACATVSACNMAGDNDKTVVAVDAGSWRTVVLRSDGIVVAVRDKSYS